MNKIFTIAEARKQRDPDLYVNLLANHPEHIARAKAKAERVRKEAARLKAAEEWRQREASHALFFSALIFIGTALLIAFC